MTETSAQVAMCVWWMCSKRVTKAKLPLSVSLPGLARYSVRKKVSDLSSNFFLSDTHLEGLTSVVERQLNLTLLFCVHRHKSCLILPFSGNFL